MIKQRTNIFINTPLLQIPALTLFIFIFITLIVLLFHMDFFITLYFNPNFNVISLYYSLGHLRNIQRPKLTLTC